MNLNTREIRLNDVYLHKMIIERDDAHGMIKNV